VSNDPFVLQRFVAAQDPVFEAVREELARGRKQSHWMWFVFPQIAGLGFSAMSQTFAISSLNEARAYLAHPILGERLREITEVVLQTDGKSARAIFGSPDDLKLRSCLTLFAEASREEVFIRGLDKFFDGEADAATLGILRESSS
jgi:uncharacterized protein (DUF1810 family)